MLYMMFYISLSCYVISIFSAVTLEAHVPHNMNLDTILFILSTASNHNDNVTMLNHLLDLVLSLSTDIYAICLMPVLYK